MMTDAQTGMVAIPHDGAREILERWPGYAEQSWQQRFAVLDRMLLARDTTLMNIAKKFHARPSPAAPDAGVIALREALAEAVGTMALLKAVVEVNRRLTKEEDAAVATNIRSASAALQGAGHGEGGGAEQSTKTP